MKGKKIVFLFLALLLPVAIFLFLKQFGKNEFEVPVLYQEGTINAPEDCQYTYNTPYRIADSVMMKLTPNNEDSLYVVFFDAAGNAGLERISYEFSNDPVRLVDASHLEIADPSIVQKCILLMGSEESVALVDHRKRIRGYYGIDREEVDRLVVEIKIMLKQY